MTLEIVYKITNLDGDVIAYELDGYVFFPVDLEKEAEHKCADVISITHDNTILQGLHLDGNRDVHVLKEAG